MISPPPRTVTPWMLWWAVLVHSVLGLLLIFDPTVSRFSVLIGLHFFFDLGVPAEMFGTLLICVSLVAAFALIFEKRLEVYKVILLLTPQYFLVLAALLSDAYTLASGNFHGSPFPFSQGLAGLWPVMAAALLHTVALLERYGKRWTWR